jgi:DivIVA domain-containing protein
MAIERLTVTRTDFPMSRRGYDRIAVDRHLDEVAREIEALQMQRPPSVGASASAQVQGILDAAEASAAEIERRAWEEATRVQEAADDALVRAREQVSQLGVASHALRQRIESLLAEVESIEGILGGMEEPATPLEGQDTMAFDPVLEEELVEEPVAEAVAEPQPEAPVDPREARFGRDTHEHTPVHGWLPHGAPASNGAVTHTTGLQEARESARLVALNMADGGEPREAADRYLSQLFEPGERQVLLDEIYGGR